MKKATTTEFIRKCTLVHGDRYDYSPTHYVSSASHVEIVCRKHGLFKQTAKRHLSGLGCLLCSRQGRYTAEDFLEHAKAVHGDTYVYSATQYTSSTAKVLVTCRKHGPFPVRPANHTHRKSGCPVCKGEASSARSSGDLVSFISKARAFHGDTYDYSVSTYVNSKARMEIICQVEGHGSFFQLPNDHLSGYGCPKCGVARSIEAVLKSPEDFLREVRVVHGDTYDYSSTAYTRAKDHIDVVCRKHGMFSQLAESHLNGSGCPTCARFNSKGQRELHDFVGSFGHQVLENARIPGTKLQMDSFVPSLMLGFEFDGIFWHSDFNAGRDSRYHLKKHKAAKAAGIRLIQVFSDEWETAGDAVRALIKNAMGESSKGLGARRFQLAKVPKATADGFYSQYHVQGPAAVAGENYALVDQEGIPVAVMTFSTAGSARARVVNLSHWELVRFASSISVPGAGSRLFSAFKREHDYCDTVVSFSNPRLFKGKMYESLGFQVDSVSPPNYTYVKRGHLVRISKSQFQRKHLPRILGDKFDPAKSEKENCTANGFYQIYDCGLVRWKWTK